MPSYGLGDILKSILGFFGLSNIVDTVQSSSTLFFQKIEFSLINFFARYAIFSAFFSAAMVIMLAIYIHKYHAMRARIIEKIIPQGNSEDGDFVKDEPNPRWKIVIDHINALEAEKWKMAILEADIILDDLLDRLHLPGDNIGEKLKAVEPSDFATIEEAWEAHKIRNAIAHEGSDFLINQREAKRVVGLYEKVFNEFEII